MVLNEKNGNCVKGGRYTWERVGSSSRTLATGGSTTPLLQTLFYVWFNQPDVNLTTHAEHDRAGDSMYGAIMGFRILGNMKARCLSTADISSDHSDGSQ